MSVLALYDNLHSYLLVGALLFGMGVYGLVTRKTLIGMLIAGEMILVGASANFMAFNRFSVPDPATGQIFALFIMAIAAAEAAIGLSIVIAIYRYHRSIDTKDIVNLKG